MRNYDYLFILACLFVVRVIALSGSYSDAICLLGLLAYLVAKEVLKVKKVSNDVFDKINKTEELNNAKFQELANELVKVRNSAEGIKAAISFNKK
jgi:hypothetical protein